MIPTFPAQSQCWKCQKALELNQFVRGDSCTQCGWDTKVCKNCFFYDPASSNECREPQIERVADKERANFCDYFKPKRLGSLESEGSQSISSGAQLKAAAEALFRKK